MGSATFEVETRLDERERLRSVFGDQTLELEAGGVVWLVGEVTLGPCVTFAGECRIQGPAAIDQGSVLTDVRLGAGARVRPYSVICEFTTGARSLLGPFCFLRDGCVAGDDVILGAHVEAARSCFGNGAKVSHRAFIGDAQIGSGAIIGAGVVFCNYDGASRQSSVVGPGATVGSGSLLVAPVAIGEGAIVGAGSVVTKPVPDNGKLLQKR